MQIFAELAFVRQTDSVTKSHFPCDTLPSKSNSNSTLSEKKKIVGDVWKKEEAVINFEILQQDEILFSV